MNIDKDKLNKGEIIEFAKKSGFGYYNKSHENIITDNGKVDLTELLTKFADLVSAHAITSMEPSEALNERNKLGYAVADVIGKLDEIIDVADEIEVNDFLHKAIPIDLWHELTEALENMPARAESFTSMQESISEKCTSEPKGYLQPNGEFWHIGAIKELGIDVSKWMPLFDHDRVKGVSDERTQTEKDLDALSKWLTANHKTELNEWRSHMVKEAFVAGRESLRQLPTNTEGWISDDDRLPDSEGQTVLIKLASSDLGITATTDDYSVDICWLRSNGKWFSSQGNYLEQVVTHWQPLPSQTINSISQPKGE